MALDAQGGSSRLCGSGERWLARVGGSGERQLRQLGVAASSASGKRDGGGLPEFTEMVLRGSV